MQTVPGGWEELLPLGEVFCLVCISALGQQAYAEPRTVLLVLERAVPSFVLPLPATPTAHLSCVRPHSRSLVWGWVGRGSPSRSSFLVGMSTLVTDLGSWARTVGTLRGAAGPAERMGLAFTLWVYTYLENPYFSGSTSPFPRGTLGT